jgi:hypothetical protein
MKRMLAAVLVLSIASMAMATTELQFSVAYKDAISMATGLAVPSAGSVVGGTFVKGTAFNAADDRLEFNVYITYTPQDIGAHAAAGLDAQIVAFDVNMVGGGLAGSGSLTGNLANKPDVAKRSSVSDPTGTYSGDPGGSLPVGIADSGANAYDLQGVQVTVGSSSDTSYSGYVADCQMFEAGSPISNLAGVIRMSWDGVTNSSFSINESAGAGLSVYADNAIGNTSGYVQEAATSTASTPISFTPEPVTMVLLGVGALFIRRRR